VEVSSAPPDLVNKLGLIGNVKVLRDLKHTLFVLRSDSSQDPLVPCPETGEPFTNGPFGSLLSLRTTRSFSMLRTELESTEVLEQVHRFRRRLALSQFFDLYEFAQKNPLFFLQQELDRTEEPLRYTTSKRAPRLDSLVLNRIVDLMFPNTSYTNKITVAAGENSRPMQEERRRAAAVHKVQDWRRNGKPWSAVIKRFGRGVLLLLPKSLSDEK